MTKNLYIFRNESNDILPDEHIINFLYECFCAPELLFMSSLMNIISN